MSRSSLDSTAPSATRRPAAEAETTAGEGVPAEQVEATHEMAVPAPAPTSATEETSTVGAAAGEAPILSFVGEAPHGGALEVAPQGSIVGGSAPPLPWRESLATGEQPIQLVGTGRDIMASGRALALNQPYGNLLACAHHAIDRLGGSLAAGLAEPEAERQRLEGSQHGKQKNFLRKQDGINPTQDLIYERLVERRRLNLTLEENRKCFVEAGAG